MPRKHLAGIFYAIAIAFLVLLLMVELMEKKQWTGEQSIN